MLAGFVLTLVALGVLAGIDSAARTSHREQVRSQASALAERDQERLRSLERDTWTEGYSESYDELVGEGDDKVSYHVESKVEWLSDDSGQALSCTSSSTRTDYFRLTSTVTGPAVGGTSAPVVIQSLAQPPVRMVQGKGTLSVRVIGDDSTPRSVVPVAIEGRVNKSQTTNAAGCAIFALIPVSNTYKVKLDNPGWVDQAGTQAIQLDAAVTEAAVTVKSVVYDRAGTITAQFKQHDGTTEAKSTRFRVVKDTLVKQASGARASELSLPSLFPFAAPAAYTVYAGNCDQQNPANFGHAPATVVLAPGTTVKPVVKLRKLDLVVMTQTGGAAPNATWPTTKVRAVFNGTSCTDTYDWTGIRNSSTDDMEQATGTLTSPWLPYGGKHTSSSFGTWTVHACATRSDGTTSWKTATDVDLMATAAGSSSFTLTIPNSTPGGTWPCA
jgi:hypothetical protein